MAHSTAHQLTFAFATLLSAVGIYSLAARVLQWRWRRGVRSASLALAIANACLQAGENAKAAVFFREAFRKDGTLVEAQGGLVCALFRSGSIREAAREAEALGGVLPCAEVWTLAGELRRRAGDSVGSIEAFRRAASAAPAPENFVLGEGILGEAAWGGLAGALANLKTARRAVGVGTHIVRGRTSLVSRIFSMGRMSLLLVALQSGPAGSVEAQEADPREPPSPQVSPSPTPRFHPAVVAALPTAGSLTARVVQLNSGLVLEREEGAGLFPAEPSRFGFRGGSWTQSRVEIDGFDVTDPILGGRALVWGSVELGEVDVRTDREGTAIMHTHPAARAPGRQRFLAAGNAGVFDSTGTTADPIPSLARGHRLFDGLLAAFGVTKSGATSWSGALSGADVSRSERDSDFERPTQRLGFEARLNHTRGVDEFQGLAMYQGRRRPFGLTRAETRAAGLMIGAAWSRPGGAGDLFGGMHGRASYLRGSEDDPTFTSAVPFERLVDGPFAQQVPHLSTGDRIRVEGATRTRSLGGKVDVSLMARFSRARAERTPAQTTFQATESLNGISARQWSLSGSAASRLAETRAGVALGLGVDLSSRARLVGTVELQRLSVGDLDGERILGATRVLPEIELRWRKSAATSLFAAASIGTPPVPLVGYETATRTPPVVSARRWRDLNGDGRASEAELGLEVTRRGPGSVSVDPDLSPPAMRRVIVGFETRVFGIGIRATAFARRDVNLMETALDPPGSEVLAVRNLEDPSGDILGASDDQILPIVEENPASFSGSRFLLTNPPEHRALGEGAELGFETHGRHIHWGLTGAAFRDSGRGGYRGLRVGENDFGVVGESFDAKNADTFGYGRLFFDRAYSLRMYLAASDLRGFTFGAVGRYDDGQPFARLVIQEDLPQGPDFVQAIPRGRARLHYTLSVDARVARRFKLGDASVELSASVFNALGSRFEAEEQVVWLPDYRRITMVQPPRAFLLGIRLER